MICPRSGEEANTPREKCKKEKKKRVAYEAYRTYYQLIRENGWDTLCTRRTETMNIAQTLSQSNTTNHYSSVIIAEFPFVSSTGYVNHSIEDVVSSRTAVNKKKRTQNGETPSPYILYHIYTLNMRTRSIYLCIYEK